MLKTVETFVTVKGTFAIYESRARNWVAYKTAEIYLKNGIRQNKENTLCEFRFEKRIVYLKNAIQQHCSELVHME